MKTREEYVNDKHLYSYNLYKNHKFFKKARALILYEGKLCVIEVTHENGEVYYLLPGGGVDEGETASQAAAREAHEEYGVLVECPKYLGRKYYSCPDSYNGTEFKSNRVEYYYIFTLDDKSKFDSSFGLEGEFAEKGDNYKKITLSYDEVKRTSPKAINKMSEAVYKKLLEFMKK